MKEYKQVLSLEEKTKVITEKIIVKESCSLSNVTFSGEEAGIIIERGGYFKGNNIEFKNNIVAIRLMDEVQAMELSNCKFNNYNKSIVIEGSYEFIGIYSNLFLDGEVVIEMQRLYQKRTFIYSNKFINNEKCISIKKQCLDSAYVFIRKILSSNENIEISFERENQEIIAKYYYAYCSEDLIRILMLCYDGSLIYVTGIHRREYYINKSVVLKGFNKCVFKGMTDRKIQYALTLDSQYIEILNIEISDYYYGIRILKSKEQHIEIRNCFVKNCMRRGISIWPNNKGKYMIFENVFKNNGINIFTTVKIEESFNIYL